MIVFPLRLLHFLQYYEIVHGRRDIETLTLESLAFYLVWMDNYGRRVQLPSTSYRILNAHPIFVWVDNDMVGTTNRSSFQIRHLQWHQESLPFQGYLSLFLLSQTLLSCPNLFGHCREFESYL